jgi:four helix bundle protein
MHGGQRPEARGRKMGARPLISPLLFIPESIRSFRELRVYQQAFDLQQEIFRLSKRWPTEEKYALTDQVRRSSRSIGANVAESWAKRSYPAHFVSKLTDADGELQETDHWFATALACEYLDTPQHSEL